jgi:hypothetical protein
MYPGMQPRREVPLTNGYLLAPSRGTPWGRSAWKITDPLPDYEKLLGLALAEGVRGLLLLLGLLRCRAA